MPGDEEQVVVPRAAWEAVLARLEALERGRAGIAPPMPVDAVPHPVRTVTRRRALGLAGAATAGAAVGAIATLGSGNPAAAANGGSVLLGSSSNGATAATGIVATGSDLGYGLGVVDNQLPSVISSQAILAHARQGAFDRGIGVEAEASADGIVSQSAAGTAIQAASGTGLAFSAASTQAPTTASVTNGNAAAGIALALHAARVGATIDAAHDHLVLQGSIAPPTSRTTTSAAGTVVADRDGSLWLCVLGGTPGTWRELGGRATAGSLHLLPVPVRIYDSRSGSVPSQGPKSPFAAGATRVLDCKVNSSGVPAGATGVLLTVLLVNAATASANLTIWANGKPKPASNAMVWGGSAGRFTGSATTAVDATAKVQVNASAKTDLVLDVVGYYR